MGVRNLLCASQIRGDEWSQPRDRPVETKGDPVITLNHAEGCAKSGKVFLEVIACFCGVNFSFYLKRHCHVGGNSRKIEKLLKRRG